jgi:hypothetical protein
LPYLDLRITLFITVLVWVLPPPLHGGDWKLLQRDDTEAIAVHFRTLPSGHVEFLATTRVHSSLGAFVALFEDVEAMPRWVDRTDRVEVLERMSPTEVYARTVNHAPWPLQKRDAVVRSVIEQDPATLAVTIRGQAEPDRIPVREGFVRMPIVHSTWRFTPEGSGQVAVAFQGYADPGGNLPAALFRWVSRFLLGGTPYKTLQGMKRTVTQEAYQDRRYPFIREPP